MKGYLRTGHYDMPGLIKELHGFEQDDYAFYSDADERNAESIFEEYEAVRN